MIRVLVASLAAYLALLAPAFAYLDPGTGMLVVQAIGGAVAVVLVAWRGFWVQIRSFFGRARAAVVPAANQKPHSSDVE